MKFYDFSDYEYYALIGVLETEKYPMDVAIKVYEENVGELEEYEKEIAPREITEEQALKIYKKSNIEGCKTEEEKVEEFKKQIDLGNKTCIRYRDNKWVLLLIDGSLI